MGSRSGSRARAQANGAPSPERRPRPKTLVLAALVEGLEVAGICVASVLAAIATIQGRSYQDSSGIAITLIGFGTAVALAFVAAGLAAGRRWSRTPALLTQLFTGIVGVYLVQGQRLWWGVPAVALTAVGFAALLAPSSFRALAYGRADDRPASAK